MAIASTTLRLVAESPAALSAEKISKKYCAHFRKAAWYGLRRIFRTTLQLPAEARLLPEEFWALRDVSVTLRPGEAVGLMGPNGSGKTTLLRILAGLSPKDFGSLTATGRVTPVLNVRTGLSPILTVAENARMLLALAGFRGEELRDRGARACELAGLSDRLATPLRFLSAGMFSRLSFACAMETTPRVLLLDETFAVGDQEFRAKGVAQIRGFVERGGAVILCTHSRALLGELCSRTLLLHRGTLVDDGNTEEVLAHYLRLSNSTRTL